MGHDLRTRPARMKETLPHHATNILFHASNNTGKREPKTDAPFQKRGGFKIRNINSILVSVCAWGYALTLTLPNSSMSVRVRPVRLFVCLGA